MKPAEFWVRIFRYPTVWFASPNYFAQISLRTFGPILTLRDIIADAAEPLFIVKGHKVTLPVVAMPSAEQSLIERASISLGFEVEQKQLTVEMLQDAEEVVIASWQGLTAINHIDSKPYMSIIAERIAAQMEHREKKQ